MDEIGFIGHVQVGGKLPLALQCRDQNGTPTTPDASPSYAIYPPDFSGAIDSGTLGDIDFDGKVGLRVKGITISADKYAPGTLYTVAFSYDVNSVTRRSIGFFYVL